MEFEDVFPVICSCCMLLDRLVCVSKVDRRRGHRQINKLAISGVTQTMDVAVFKPYNISCEEWPFLAFSKEERPLTGQGVPDLLRCLVRMTRLRRAGL